MISFWRLSIAAALLAATLGLQGQIAAMRRVPLRQPLARFPLELAGWQGVPEKLSPEVEEVLGATDYLDVNYQHPQYGSLNFAVIYFDHQTRGKLIHSPKHCLPGTGWRFQRYRLQPIALNPQGGFEAVSYLVQKDNERVLVLYWFQERGRQIHSEYASKAYLVWDALTRQRSDGALVRVIVPVTGPEEKSRAVAVGFVQQVFPLLEHFLPA